MRYELRAMGQERLGPTTRWAGDNRCIPPPVATPEPDCVLLPIDPTNCPLQAFRLVNRMVERGPTTVVLLHVVHLNIPVPENRVYDELGQEAREQLSCLARQYLHPNARVILRVDLGNPAEQILAIAEAEGVGLIVLSSRGSSVWARLVSFFKPAGRPFLSRLVRKLVREAPCSVLVLRKPGMPGRFRAWWCLRELLRPGTGALRGQCQMHPGSF